MAEVTLNHYDSIMVLESIEDPCEFNIGPFVCDALTLKLNIDGEPNPTTIKLNFNGTWAMTTEVSL